MGCLNGMKRPNKSLYENFGMSVTTNRIRCGVVECYTEMVWECDENI